MQRKNGPGEMDRISEVEDCKVLSGDVGGDLGRGRTVAGRDGPVERPRKVGVIGLVLRGCRLEKLRAR